MILPQNNRANYPNNHMAHHTKISQNPVKILSNNCSNQIHAQTIQDSQHSRSSNTGQQGYGMQAPAHNGSNATIGNSSATPQNTIPSQPFSIQLDPLLTDIDEKLNDLHSQYFIDEEGYQNLRDQHDRLYNTMSEGDSNVAPTIQAEIHNFVKRLQPKQPAEQYNNGTQSMLAQNRQGKPDTLRTKLQKEHDAFVQKYDFNKEDGERLSAFFSSWHSALLANDKVKASEFINQITDLLKRQRFRQRMDQQIKGTANTLGQNAPPPGPPQSLNYQMGELRTAFINQYQRRVQQEELDPEDASALKALYEAHFLARCEGNAQGGAQATYDAIDLFERGCYQDGRNVGELTASSSQPPSSGSQNEQRASASTHPSPLNSQAATEASMKNVTPSRQMCNQARQISAAAMNGFH